jgi:hypothetical protein
MQHRNWKSTLKVVVLSLCRVPLENLKAFSEHQAEKNTSSTLLITDIEWLGETDCSYRINVFRPASRWISGELSHRKTEKGIIDELKSTIGIDGQAGHFVGAIFEHMVHQLLAPTASSAMRPPQPPEFHCRILPPPPPAAAAAAAVPVASVMLTFPIATGANRWPLCNMFDNIAQVTHGAPGSYWRPVVCNFPPIDGIIKANPVAGLNYPALLQMCWTQHRN